MRLISGAIAVVLLAVNPAWSHDGNTQAPAFAAVAEHWVLALGLLACAAAYAVGARRTGRRGAGPVRGPELAAFASAWMTLVIALLSPLDTISGMRFSAHMVQHELLVLVAAPLLAIARAPLIAALGFPIRPRQMAALASRLRLGVPTACLLHGLTLWLWHAPGPFQAALRSDTIHAIEHVTLLGTGLLLWQALLARGVRGYGLAGLALFITATHTGVLGALLTFAPHPLYPAYIAAAPEGLSPLQDQQLAGIYMWVPGGVIYTVTGVVMAGMWLRRMNSMMRIAVPLAALCLVIVAASGCSEREAKAARAAQGNPARGKELIQAYGCASCHTIPGVPGADGKVGPPLDGVADRAYVAGQENTPAHLGHWIQHPQQVRPGTPMPEMGVTEPDSRDIAAYLYTLR